VDPVMKVLPMLISQWSAPARVVNSWDAKRDAKI